MATVRSRPAPPLLANGVIDAIGHTPLVRLKVGAAEGVAVYAKLEMQNLFGMKDRIAKQIIIEARRRGDLSPAAPIIESSSGTMALGVALVGTSLGHPVHIVTDPRIDRITLAKLRALGCAVHVVEKMDEHGWQGARLSRLAELMAELPGAFCPRQYENPDNPAAYRALAEELIADLGSLDVLVGSVGSGGSLCGTTRALRRSMPALHVVGVDCVGSVIFGQPDRPARLQSGLGSSLRPANVDHSLIDEVHWLNDHEAFAAARTLAREEALFCGNTSGSVYRVLGALAARVAKGTRIVGIFPDRGDRYTETVYSDSYWVERGVTAAPVSEKPRQVPPGTAVSTWSYARLGDTTPPRLVFVESNTTGSGMAALRSARRLGFEPVLFTSRPERYLGLADTGCFVVRCHTNDVDALLETVLATCEVTTIGGVTTTSEYYLHAVASLAAKLGLPGEDPEAVGTCRDKGRLRQALDRAGVRQPGFEVVRTAAEAVRAVARIGTPCVVKPVDDTGSSRVRLCQSAAEAASQVDAILAVTANARGQPAARRALVEEYLSAPEYSVEMFGTGEEQRLLGIVEKSVTGLPSFVEHRHILPAELSAQAASEMTATVRRALAAARLSRGPSHTEVKVDQNGAAIIEINPRLAGGMIPELFRLSTGVDLLECQINRAAGRDVDLPDGFRGYAGIQFLVAAATGRIASVTGTERAGALDGVRQVTIAARVGQEVGPAVDAYGRIGYVIASGASRAAVVNALGNACNRITIEIEGQAT